MGEEEVVYSINDDEFEVIFQWIIFKNFDFIK